MHSSITNKTKNQVERTRQTDHCYNVFFGSLKIKRSIQKHSDLHKISDIDDHTSPTTLMKRQVKTIFPLSTTGTYDGISYEPNGEAAPQRDITSISYTKEVGESIRPSAAWEGVDIHQGTKALWPGKGFDFCSKKSNSFTSQNRDGPNLNTLEYDNKDTYYFGKKRSKSLFAE